MDILEEVVAGIREYFDKSLSRILLYRYALVLSAGLFCPGRLSLCRGLLTFHRFRFERHQYMDIRKLWDSADQSSKYKGVCDVFGAEHLARLIGMSSFSFFPFFLSLPLSVLSLFCLDFALTCRLRRLTIPQCRSPSC